MRFRIVAGLILCNLIWSANPLMCKWVLEDFPPIQAGFFRYLSALFSFWMVTSWVPVRARISPARDYRLAALMGVLAFCVSPILQMTGLTTSRATDNALIVAMEPIITVFTAYLFLREKLSLDQLATFAIALGGFSLLSGLGLSPGWIGDFLMLLSLFGEAAYSVGGRNLASRHDSRAIFRTALTWGVLAFVVVELLLRATGHLSWSWNFSWKSIVGLLWLGPLGTTLTYVFWIAALREAPVAPVALTLFIQPVFGTVWGALLLGERLSAVQFLGGFLIFAAVLAQTGYQIGIGEVAAWRQRKRRKWLKS